MATAETPQAASEALPFSEQNRDGKATILLIHGAFASRHEWDAVASYLQDCHLLLPDLPAHGEAKHLQPFSKSKAASLLADLIRARGKEGKAHVVGSSLGAYVAVELASKHPDLVNEAFVSGFKIFPTTALKSAVAPRAMWLDHQVPKLMPKSMYRWLMDGVDPG
jgi:pimeloyl-ACP methyl ester carboxylesterase